MQKLFFSLILIVVNIAVFAQRKTENVIIVTLDGMRWQEVFKGLDPVLASDSSYVRDRDDLKRDFGAATPEESRKKIFTFFWNTIAKQGQLHGNRTLNSTVDNANKYWFSYPGYNEIFTGYPDTAVNSNDKTWNKNINVLEFLNNQSGMKGKVAAFTTWDVFPYILNRQRSGLYVNADADSFNFNTPTLKMLNDMQYLAPRPIGVRPDLITYMAAREYLKAYKPKVLYISFDETDDFAHGGLYDQYLKAAHAEDAMIGDLWNIIQSMPEYKDKTTLIVTTDHGRGDKVKGNWRHHGERIEDAHEIWIAAIGPDMKPLGEVSNGPGLFQQQIAATIAQLLGFQFTANHPVAAPIPSIYKK
jgi:hypothetical protein